MRLVDFLIAMLEAHAQTLQRLAALLGEEILIELLESCGEEDSDSDGKADTPPPLELKPEWLDTAAPFSESSAYGELEGAVSELKLSAMLEFHLWAYPNYRSWIESPLPLNTRIRGTGSEAGITLVDDAVANAEAWIKKLPLPPSISQQAERAAQIPWLRFRTLVLKRIGKRPLGPVYG
jgi:hypothetical protein